MIHVIRMKARIIFFVPPRKPLKKYKKKPSFVFADKSTTTKKSPNSPISHDQGTKKKEKIRKKKRSFTHSFEKRRILFQKQGFYILGY